VLPGRKITAFPATKARSPPAVGDHPNRAPVLNGPVAHIRRSRTIGAELPAVWDVLADFGAISSWCPNVDHSCLLEHEPVSRRIQVGRTVVVERITDFEPPHTLGYDIEGLPRQLRVHADWRLTPSGEKTIATLTTTVDIGTNPLQRIAEHAACRVLARQSAVILAGLARRMESR